MLTSLIFLLGVSPSPALGGQAEPLFTPYRQEVDVTRVGEITRADAVKNTPAGATIDIAASFRNPFDPTDIAVDVLIDSPSGKALEVPAFFYRDAKRGLKDGKEVITPVGKPEWRFWWTPRETGAHTWRARVRNSAGETLGTASKVLVADSASPGFVRVSSKDRRFFAFDNGQPYYPLGANICWGGDKGTFNFDDWIPKYSNVGANYGRLWLSPGWSTFSLESRGKTEEGKGMGQFDLNNLWRLDYVVQIARENGMHLMLTIDSYNILRNRDGAPYWDESPHNSDNGGPLRIWSDFWTSEKMDKLYRAKLRYLVARYGADPTVMAWEFWNEVDLTRDFDAARVQAWHQRMGQYLRSIDPYKHLISTSFSSTNGVREIDSLPEIDFIQSHHYSSPDIAGMVAQTQSKKQSVDKPHYFSELGADWQGPRADIDPTGIQIHDPLWMSIGCGSAGAAMPWWWDNYTAPKNLYSVWEPAAAFVKDVDWPTENFRLVRPSFRYQHPAAKPITEDLVIAGGPVSWEPGQAFNRPRKVTISRSGAVSGELPVSALLHGRVNHPDMTNPVRFSVNLARPTKFSVGVTEVSGYGGAALRISVDGIPVADKAFPDPDGNAKTDTLTKYNGNYEVTVPAGEHRVTVENPGADWVGVSYRWQNLKKLTVPPLESWAVTGDNMALGWVRRAGRSWQAVCVEKRKFTASAPAFLSLKGLATGPWTAEIWNTNTGVITAKLPLTVKSSGMMEIPLPAVVTDIAFKLRRSK